MARAHKEPAAAAPPAEKVALGAEHHERLVKPFDAFRNTAEDARLARADLNAVTLRILRELGLSADEFNIAFNPADKKFWAVRMSAQTQGG